jgi:hypothetical protein
MTGHDDPGNVVIPVTHEAGKQGFEMLQGVFPDGVFGHIGPLGNPTGDGAAVYSKKIGHVIDAQNVPDHGKPETWVSGRGKGVIGFGCVHGGLFSKVHVMDMFCDFRITVIQHVRGKKAHASGF